MDVMKHLENQEHRGINGHFSPIGGPLFLLKIVVVSKRIQQKRRVAWPLGIPGQHRSEVLHSTDRC